MDVVLVGLGGDLSEMRALIDSAGYRLVREIVQRRTHPDPRTFVGKGKLEELKTAVKESGVPVAIFAGSLKPSQHYELEKVLQVQCYDRVRVILEIFTQRASSREAQLQVELAMLQYEIPILKEWIHAAALGERPGFMAGGEYRVDAFYETVKRKIVKVREALEAVKRERAVRRERRQDRGFIQVSIAGYANAGKSSLFNVLSGEKVLVEDRLFTTLATTTRAVPRTRRRILLTDTVGFVADIPLWLVEAFRSTFEEVFQSDLVLLLLDASDSLSKFEAKVRLAVNTLTPAISVDRILPVLTKTDLATDDGLEAQRRVLGQSELHRRPAEISVNRGTGLNQLRIGILAEFRYPVYVTIRVPLGEGSSSFLSWLHDTADVHSVDFEPKHARIELSCRERDLPRIRGGCAILAGPRFEGT